MKRFRTGAISTVLLFAVTAFPLVSQTPGNENVSFTWAFGALCGPQHTLVRIEHDTVLASGDELKMYVELTKECFVYVLYENSQGEFSLLFPTDGFRQFTKDYNLHKPYLIPKGRSWFTLDKKTGTETFYLLGSAERLIDLEAAYGDYASAEPGKKPSLAKNLAATLKSVRKRYKSYATFAEKPITIGGNVRGMEKKEESRRPDVTTISTLISASNLFSKVITIDHQ